MHTLEDIRKFCSNFGFKPVITGSEIKQLPTVLQADEQLLAVTEGFLKEVHGRKIAGNGVIVVTDKRVLFYRKSIIGTETREEVPLSKVSSASIRKGMLDASIHITTSNNGAEIIHVDKKLAQKTVTIISDLISKETGSGGRTSQATAPISVADELKKLAELRDSGALTEDEFLSEKKKLLNR